MTNRGGNTPLHEAVRHSRSAVAFRLLEAEPSRCHALNERMELPLHMAAREGLADVVAKIVGYAWVEEQFVPSVSVSGTALYQAVLGHIRYNHHPVPLWEREFCSYVGAISWQRFCENKKFVPMYKNIEEWDDLGAFENFENAKARFWANYHGLPSDIPLPDRDMYIDKVDRHCKIDPELVADLDKERQPFETDNELLPAAGLGNTDAENKCTQNQSGNWDIYIEKPAEVNKWEDNSRSNSSWGMEHGPFNKWGKNCSGWGDALVKTDWGSSSNNHYSSNNRDSFNVVSSNRYQDPRSIPGRKRNRGGYFQQRNSKHRNQAEGYQRSRWQDRRGRNSEWLPFDNRPNGQGIEHGF